MGPFRREEVGIFLGSGLRHLLERQDLHQAARQFITGMLANEPPGSFGDVLNGFHEGLASNPDAV